MTTHSTISRTVDAARTDVPSLSSAETWFAAGERVGYDALARALVVAKDAPLKIFLSREGDPANAVSFLPGFPDGSFGWARVRPHLASAAQMPKIFFDYVGMGDSDKPKDYTYSTAERTDLVEAIWRDLSVRSTTLVAFDFSSLVVLEHLRRRLERIQRGEPVGGPEIRGVFIFNGGLFTDGHTHPWFTTPVLRRLPKAAHKDVGRSFALFRMTAGALWSKRYGVSDAELRDLYNVMSRHDGLFYLAAAAGFEADHRAQGDRLDFGNLFKAYRSEFPFLVGGSVEDRFEHRQVDLARERLGNLGLQIEKLPGGHLTTHEQPEALADLISRFERSLTSAQSARLPTRGDLTIRPRPARTWPRRRCTARSERRGESEGVRAFVRCDEGSLRWAPRKPLDESQRPPANHSPRPKKAKDSAGPKT